MNRRHILAMLSLPLISAAAFAAPPEGKGKGNNKGKGDKHSGHDAHGGGDTVIISAGISSSRARDLALQYRYTGYGALPPGIRKNLARGKPLPPGIAKKAVPSAMLRELPYHDGYEWRVAGTDLVLVAIATAIVVDVLLDVFQ